MEATLSRLLCTATCKARLPRPATGSNLRKLPTTVGRRARIRFSGTHPQLEKAEDPMKKLAKKVQQFLVSEDGPTAVEYAVMLALIVIVCLTAIRSIGTNANATFEEVATQLGS
jgi:pilus assembly protein Flp/PilA